MTDWWRRLLGRRAVPAQFPGRLEPHERVLTVATVASGDAVVLTSLGMWVPEGRDSRRIGWHWISKAVWDRNALLITEAVPDGEAGAAVLLADLPARRLTLPRPGRVPEVVHERVNGSIRTSQHRSVPGGGARFVQRKVPGRDGVVLQVRPDPGADRDAVRRIAADVAERMQQTRPHG